MRCLEKQSSAVRWYRRQVRSNVYLSGKPERQKHHVPLDTARYADHHHRCSVVCRLCGSIISEGMREEIKTAYENGIAVLGRDLSIADIEDAVFGETEQCCEMV